MSESILIHRADGVLALTLNRPTRKNALNLSMYEALTEALRGAQSDPEVRVVLFRGEGDTFCGGNDMADFLKNPPTGPSSPVMQFLAALAGSELPLVCAVQGGAVGIGTTMLLHCDLAYAADDAFFKMPFVQLGLCPEAGSSLLVPGLVGQARAFELLVLGERFDAAQAEQMGFVNRVVPRASLDAAAREAAARIAALPPDAVRTSKALLRAPQREAVQRTIAEEGSAFVERLSSPEAKEAISAFFDKRKPDFAKLRA